MTEIKRSILVPYSATQMYDLVKDLGSYPEFVSWCKGVEVHSEASYKVKANIEASKYGMDFTFSILYQLEPAKLIKIFLMNKGPFRSIEAFWRFQAIDDHQSQLGFELQYELSNALLGWTVTPIIKNEVNNILKELSQRAATIYEG